MTDASTHLFSEGQLNPEWSNWTCFAQSRRSFFVRIEIWLWILNGVIFLSLFFLERREAQWTIAAYLAAVPMILFQGWAQRGVTRLIGVGHILPWFPLVVYLCLRLWTDAVGLRLSVSEAPTYTAYVHVLLATLTVCLGFDFFDLYRWLRGERFVLGSPLSVRHGASKLAPRLRNSQ